VCAPEETAPCVLPVLVFVAPAVVLEATCFLFVVCVLLPTFADFAWWIVVVAVADSLSPLTTRQRKIPNIRVTNRDIYIPLVL
jgi:hypothetical protein